MTNGSVAVRRALISVFDKTGVEDFARSLHDAGVELVSTGSTAQRIAAAGVPVTPVEEITQFPECLDGRVKTLHPRIHAGILADMTKKAHAAELQELEVEPFQLVVVNLYPFQETVASGADAAECIEKIDIGGPTMVRAAAKNHHSVAVVVDPADYSTVAAAVQAGALDLRTRQELAAKAFRHTAEYDIAVATWFSSTADTPEWVGASYTLDRVLRYGENPHQKAALYSAVEGGGLASAKQFGGKEMSFNNYQDSDAAWRAAWDYSEPAVAIIKHANPCGIAVADDIAAAHAAAHACDPVSAYGGVIAANRPVTAEMAAQVRPIFTEVIIAPAYDAAALEILQEKKNLRILQAEAPTVKTEFKEIAGGLLVQEKDLFQATGDDSANWELVAGEPADAATMADLEFAWRAARAVKSNAIVLAKDRATVGAGMGQVNRVDSAKLAVERANTLAPGEERARGAVAASDAFFPFADGFQVLADAGVVAVVQPGGSIRDEEVIAAAAAAGVTMYTTGGTRHFFH
ncbi:bifunctional phosphoribosylaminoimidazolecarboxamide formyltransferase/IMP cyclohydrolase [Corynebacterium caspium]|uniref:bifunctional phosphoribosylaminoimidazolecarboxamide formyltransferase/IMP cyclohydrolase n=1 Tax=Corynebacterium caspium TaxID=234828 RepID=UPI000373B1B1|nr:bifunctional phosphoribosylaminoimidazolecarboxamide formyltransferase/IMP cyclohydrolase [Corynebacterium caspium]WKD59636.1 Bifunctional purine biosynthesis protein PurH [Corynebacterium caspium DSM 44850]